MIHDNKTGKFKSEKLHDKFWSKVNKNGPIQDHVKWLGRCWIFTGFCRTRGYGVMWHNGKRINATAASWVIHHGTVKMGARFLHHCDNPSCVRPSHLFIGTQADNMKDMAMKGRHGVAKLKASDVVEIISNYHSGIANQPQLAKKYGVSQVAISKVILRKNWNHVKIKEVKWKQQLPKK